ncbi:MAG TPA: methyltransferase [Polyangia bacterium]
MTIERGGAAVTVEDEGDVTIDTLLRGRVTLVQPARGFRSSVDPLLLAAFVRPPFGRFVDIGCGTGALAFALAALDPAATGVAVEIQPRLARLAARGLARNPFADRLAIVEADVRRAAGDASLPPASFDLVATNPPFRVVGGGFVSPDGERARAHHEVTLKLAEWLDAAATLVRPGGRVAAVFVAARHAELLAEMRARALAPRRLRFVHARLDEPPSRVLVEAIRSNREEPLVVEEPLPLRGPNGHSEEVRRMLGEA